MTRVLHLSFEPAETLVCRHATTSLPPVPRSSSVAREFVLRCLTDWDLLPLLDDAQLAVAELVTNAVLHARTPLLVSISSAERQLELAVFDGNPALPRPRPPRSDLTGDIDALIAAEADLRGPVDERDPRLNIGPAGSLAGGRGLLLVAALSAEWGVSPLSDGKAVWVRTPTPEAWSFGADCTCSDATDGPMLASGRPVLHRTS